VAVRHASAGWHPKKRKMFIADVDLDPSLRWGDDKMIANVYDLSVNCQHE
jgi:hypothetical protein